ncbi:hypothetical protein [Streptomyces sp. NBC_01500]|uniref:DUF6915 family protein n=1 Tax=Streptomyces sp. NBC_01500 TaxID=2903886 RepID=UPI002257FF42|nr:hypothetical protein [Streptomyces sp. NBC_01500]MCX4554121.1 hypothetical protein [Streptomyces sp. NBC_01500]
MNSWNHAVSAAKKWGGQPEHYLPIEEFIDSSKKVLGDARHHHVMALDPDTGDAYDINTAEHAPDEEAVWLQIGLL